MPNEKSIDRSLLQSSSGNIHSTLAQQHSEILILTVNIRNTEVTTLMLISSKQTVHSYNTQSSNSIFQAIKLACTGKWINFRLNQDNSSVCTYIFPSLNHADLGHLGVQNDCRVFRFATGAAPTSAAPIAAPTFFYC